MSKGVTQKGKIIRQYILTHIPPCPFTVISKTCEHFGITRQAASRYMRKLIAEDKVLAQGNTRNKQYALKKKPVNRWELDLNGLDESQVWRDKIEPLTRDYPTNVHDIWEYGFTEMLNNAIDHSDGSKVIIDVYKGPISLDIHIIDDGVGIFRKIKESCGLDDERHAVLELAKGKFTTDPANHSGEGIFFTSRCFDCFDINSGNVFFDHHERINDEHWVMENENIMPGTIVSLELAANSDKNLEAIFSKYATAKDDYDFNKTVVPVSLLRHGKENLVSRSQAKRLMKRVERFKTVILNFKDVPTIGQAFADEVFRVFTLKHPEVKVVPVNTNPSVMRMVRRAKARLKEMSE